MPSPKRTCERKTQRIRSVVLFSTKAKGSKARKIARSEDERINGAVCVDEDISEGLKMILVHKVDLSPGGPHPEYVPGQHADNEHDNGEAEHFDDTGVSLQAVLLRVVLNFRVPVLCGTVVELEVTLVQPKADACITVSYYAQRDAVVDDKKCQSVIVLVSRPSPYFITYAMVVSQRVDVRKHDSNSHDPDDDNSFQDVVFFELGFQRGYYDTITLEAHGCQG